MLTISSRVRDSWMRDAVHVDGTVLQESMRTLEREFKRDASLHPEAYYTGISLGRHAHSLKCPGNLLKRIYRAKPGGGNQQWAFWTHPSGRGRVGISWERALSIAATRTNARMYAPAATTATARSIAARRQPRGGGLLRRPSKRSQALLGKGSCRRTLPASRSPPSSWSLESSARTGSTSCSG